MRFWKGAKFAGSVGHPMTKMLSASQPLTPSAAYDAHPQRRRAACWPRLIAAAAAFTFTRSIRKLPTVLGRRAVSLQK